MNSQRSTVPRKDKRRVARIAGLVAAVALAAGAITLAFGAQGGPSVTVTSSVALDRFNPTPTPTPARLTGIPPIATARAVLAQRSPGLAQFISAAEAGDVDAVLGRFAWRRLACDAMVYRGVSECQRRGIAPGSVLEMFRPDYWEGDGMERTDIRQEIEYALRGRHARLSFVADRDDGAIFVLFSIDPKLGLRFPGAVPVGGPNVDVVYLVTASGDASLIATYGFKFAGSPPLEFIHYDERHGTHRYTILGASDEFRAKEASSFATIEAGSGRSRR